MSREGEVLEARFACIEKGCEGLVDPSSEKKHRLQLDCSTSESAVACPECRRLYWLNGTTVLDCESKKMFALPGEKGVISKDLHAIEKHNLILDTLGELGDFIDPSSPEVHESIKRRLAGHMARGHAKDCEATIRNAPVLCNCGIANGEEWLENHPDDVLE